RTQFHRPRRHCAGATLQPGLARRRSGGTTRAAVRARGYMGVHVCGRVHEGWPEKRQSRRGDSALQAECRARVGEIVLSAEGGVMAHIAEHYTEYHPRWLRPHISTYWWLRKRSYFAFILREISSLFVAWAAVYLLLIVYATARGPAEYAALLEWARQPWVLIVNV